MPVITTGARLRSTETAFWSGAASPERRRAAIFWIGAAFVASGACGGNVAVDSAGNGGAGGGLPAFDAAAGRAGSAGTFVLNPSDGAPPDVGFSSCPALEDVPVELGDTAACEVTFPPLGGGRKFNPNHVNIEIETAEGRRSLYYVGNAGCEGLADAGLELGWFYIDDREPARVGFCLETCRIILGQASGKVNILIGCATQH